MNNNNNNNNPVMLFFIFSLLYSNERIPFISAALDANSEPQTLNTKKCIYFHYLQKPTISALVIRLISP